MNYKVLISDNLSKGIVNKFQRAGIDVVYNPEIGKDNSLLLKEICNYDAIALRSDTKLNSIVLKNALKLKVIGILLILLELDRPWRGMKQHKVIVNY